MGQDGVPLTATVQESLEDYERVVYERDYPKAVAALYRCLRMLRRGVPFQGYERMNDALYTRMAGATTTLFADPKLKLSQDGFDLLATEYGVLNGLFRASGYATSEHLYRTIREDDEGLNRYLLVFPFDSQMPLDLESCFRKDPQATFALYLGMLAFPQVMTPESDARREMLLGLADVFEDVEVHPNMFNAMVAAYMHCSYAHGRDKHAPKRVIHKLLRKMMKDLPENHAPLIHKDRPTVLVPLEWWWDKHAMYRCYAQSIQQLKADFRIVGMARKENSNDAAKVMFDDFVTLENEQIFLNELVDKVRAVGPDIIYYPSIGMTIWTIALASLRLAPLQIMSYGHPATTHSPVIDYGIIEDNVVNDELYAETLVKIPQHSLRYFRNPSGAAKHWPRRLGDGEALKIGIPAMQCKVGWPFIQALQEIERRAPRPVEFHFFPYVTNLSQRHFGAQIEPMVRNKAVYECAHYAEYMGWVSHCDLALFSFPFGGTNSTVDACILGQPMVALEGQEMHAKTDAMVMRRAGLPEWLIAQDVPGYVEAVLKLFDDDTREQIAEAVRSADLEVALFAPDDGRHFLNAFRDIYARSAKRAAA